MRIKMFFVVLFATVLFTGTAYAAFTLPNLKSDGFYRQFTPVGSASHYRNVDDFTSGGFGQCNGLVDYNLTNSIGQKDSYVLDLSGVPNGSKIVGVIVVPCASKNRGGRTLSDMNVFLRVNGADVGNSARYTVAGTLPISLVTTTIPTSIIKDNNTSIEVGVEYVGGADGLRVSSMSPALEY